MDIVFNKDIIFEFNKKYDTIESILNFSYRIYNDFDSKKFVEDDNSISGNISFEKMESYYLLSINNKYFYHENKLHNFYDSTGNCLWTCIQNLSDNHFITITWPEHITVIKKKEEFIAISFLSKQIIKFSKNEDLLIWMISKFKDIAVVDFSVYKIKSVNQIIIESKVIKSNTITANESKNEVKATNVITSVNATTIPTPVNATPIPTPVNTIPQSKEKTKKRKRMNNDDVDENPSKKKVKT